MKFVDLNIVDLNYRMSFFGSSSDNLSEQNRISNVYSVLLFTIKLLKP